MERERQQELAEQIARSEAAEALAANNRKMRLERQQLDRERQRDQQMVELHYRARQQELWQSNVEVAARNAVAYRARQTLMNELEAAINPPLPPPEPEPTVVYVEAPEGSDQLGTSDFSADAWMKKPRSWW